MLRLKIKLKIYLILNLLELLNTKFYFKEILKQLIVTKII